MSKGQIIPFLSARKINKIEDYDRFYHTKSYIKQKSSKFIDNVGLMKESGYSNIDKFKKHREEWNNLKKDIPLSYLKYIGVDLEVLKKTNELDMEEYEKALLIPQYPKYFTVRLMAAVYNSVELSDNCSENKAIEIVKKFSKENGMKCWINYPFLKGIFMEGNNVDTIYYKPLIKITKKMLIILTNDGSNLGITRIA